MMQELAQLSEVQLRKCEVAREFSRAQHEILAASNKSLLEALALLCDLPLEQETEEAILNFSEVLKPPNSILHQV